MEREERRATSGDSEAAGRRRRDLRFARGLATLMSLTLVAVGGSAVLGRHYDGYSSRTGARVSLQGAPAILLGLTFVAIGLLPLGFWAKSARGAAAWGIGCAATAALLLSCPRLVENRVLS